MTRRNSTRIYCSIYHFFYLKCLLGQANGQLALQTVQWTKKGGGLDTHKWLIFCEAYGAMTGRKNTMI